jgi:bifunctional DNA-binding transcriptional regulator/antitoxin component of YhaV-PrlF toxin-antitoxin module
MTIPNEYRRQLDIKIKDWTIHAKSVNVHVIAISSLIKKIFLIRLNQAKNLFAPDIVESVEVGLLIRFEQLLQDLINEWNKAVSVDIANDFERLCDLITLQERDDANDKEVDNDVIEDLLTHSHLIIQRIDEVRFLDICDHVIHVRCQEFTKLREVTDYLEKGFEAKLSLPVKRRDDAAS